MKSLILMSGGLDSTLCAAVSKSRGEEFVGLHLNYGQLTQAGEEKAFHQICDYFGITERLVVDVSFLSQIGGSALTDNTVPVPEADLDSEKIPSTYVPFRNGNIIAIAASYAEVIGAENIYIGAVQADSSGYPDCRLDFLRAMEQAVNLGTKPETKINLIAPLVDMTKKDIVLKSVELESPIHLTRSCYRDAKIACGTCDSCALRLRGFREAGIADPIEYAKQ